MSLWTKAQLKAAPQSFAQKRAQSGKALERSEYVTEKVQRAEKEPLNKICFAAMVWASVPQRPVCGMLGGLCHYWEMADSLGGGADWEEVRSLGGGMLLKGILGPCPFLSLLRSPAAKCVMSSFLHYTLPPRCTALPQTPKAQSQLTETWALKLYTRPLYMRMISGICYSTSALTNMLGHFSS
jgi:hypothetical protein